MTYEIEMLAADIERGKQDLADQEQTAAVLRKLLATAEFKVDASRAQLNRLERRHSSAVHYQEQVNAQAEQVKASAAAPVSVREVLEEVDAKDAERVAHNEEFRPVNHRSGSAHNAYDLREKFLEYLQNHGALGQWHSRSDMCRATHAWTHWGKRVVDPLLDSLVAEGLVEIQSTENGRRIRLIPVPPQQ